MRVVLAGTAVSAGTANLAGAAGGKEAAVPWVQGVPILAEAAAPAGWHAELQCSKGHSSSSRPTRGRRLVGVWVSCAVCVEPGSLRLCYNLHGCLCVCRHNGNRQGRKKRLDTQFLCAMCACVWVRTCMRVCLTHAATVVAQTAQRQERMHDHWPTVWQQVVHPSWCCTVCVTPRVRF